MTSNRESIIITSSLVDRTMLQFRIAACSGACSSRSSRSLAATIRNVRCVSSSRRPRAATPISSGASSRTRSANDWASSSSSTTAPGASGIIATEITVKAPADGYTLLLVTTSFGVNPGLYKKLPYDPLNDLAPITHIAYAPQILVVNPSLRVQSGQGPDRARAREARRAQLRGVEHRGRDAARGRAFQPHGESEDDADPLQRRAGDAGRSHGRAHRV